MNFRKIGTFGDFQENEETRLFGVFGKMYKIMLKNWQIFFFSFKCEKNPLYGKMGTIWRFLKNNGIHGN